jgi:2-phospho-L-lactate guanylyltransferase
VNRSNVAVVVAVGPLDRGKSRLGPTLDADGRRRLVLAMLEDVLNAVVEAHKGPRYVVTPDAEVEPVARWLGAEIVEDAGNGTNAAIETALADPRVAASAAVLVVQGDLPQLTAEDVRACLDALDEADRIAVLVPNDDGGTSALGLRPPSAMAPAFGPASGDGHRASALAAGVALRELPIDSLSADVDTADDLERVRATVGLATATVLEGIALAEREAAR